MKSMNRVLPSLILLFLLSGGVCAAPDMSRTPDYSHAPAMRHLLHWGHLPVRVLFLPGPLATDAHKKDVLSGFDRWTLATLGRIRYTVVDSVKDADLAVDFDSHESLPGTKNVAGHTALYYSDDVLQKAQMTLAIGGTGEDDISNTAAHEFGHALGLDGHSDNPADIMYPELTRFVWLNMPPVPALPRLPTLRDINTLRICYPSALTDTLNASSH